MSRIPEEFHEMLAEEETFATIATRMPDGAPHLTITWVDYDPDEDLVLVNTERGRQKERNVRRDPTVGLLAVDPTNWWRYLSIMGEVETLTTDGAREHIDELARRYLGEETYPNPIQTERVLFKIRADHVIAKTA
jgi:PPOX class probable F420-dependent enzyme